MPLPSFLRRKTPAAAKTPPDTGPEAARTRARRRLIGAVLLLGIGVIAFPLLFETEPRPIPVDLPIEIPKKDGVAPLAMPSAPTAASSPAPAPSAVARAAPPPMITETAADPVPAPPAAVAAVAPAPVPAPASAPGQADGARAQALLEGRAASAPAPAGRYVVQIGAFAEEKTVREVRAKAQKAGLETYTQVITPAAGPRTRVRIGPFPRREDAEAAAARAQKAGLPASVIKL
jgi:DedD protein